MKKLISVLIAAVVLFSMIGCACGSCGAQQPSKGPDDPLYTLAYDDPAILKLLAYYQANTGYIPTFVSVTEAPEDAEKTDPASLAASAYVAVLKDEANIQALVDAGWRESHIEDNPFPLTVLRAPVSSTAKKNANGFSELRSWLNGEEAKYLAAHPDLLS